MAGRGRDAVIPAWMKGGSKPDAAPGAPLRQPSQPPSRPSQTQSKQQHHHWQELKTAGGRVYFYNTQTKTSSWDRPRELMSPEERALLGDWHEYTSPDGRKYYFNKKTQESRWTHPNPPSATTFLQGSALPPPPSTKPPPPPPLPASNLTNRLQNTTTTSALPSKALEKYIPPENALQIGSPPVTQTQMEKREIFKSLLKDFKFPSTMTIDEAEEYIIKDRRYSVFTAPGDRKDVYNEYIQWRKKEDKEEEKQRKRQAKEDFFSLLHTSQVIMNAEPPLRFEAVQILIEGYPAWNNMNDLGIDDSEKESFYTEWIEERENIKREARRAEDHRLQLALKTLLENSSWVKIDTTWKKAQDCLSGNQCFDVLPPLVRLKIWEEYMEQIEGQYLEERENIREEKRKQERQARHAFASFLQAQKKEGKINAMTRWKDYYPCIEMEPVYIALEANSRGSRPLELFMDVIEELELEYIEARQCITSALKKAGEIYILSMKENQPSEEEGMASPAVLEFLKNVGGVAVFDTFEGYRDMYRNAVRWISEKCINSNEGGDNNDSLVVLQKGLDIADGLLRVYYEEEKDKIEKAAKQYQVDFMMMLGKKMVDEGSGDVLSEVGEESITYEYAEEKCKDEVEWSAVPGGEEERRNLLQEYLKKVAVEKERKLKEKESRKRRYKSDHSHYHSKRGSGSYRRRSRERDPREEGEL